MAHEPSEIELELDQLPGVDHDWVIAVVRAATVAVDVDLAFGADLGVTSASASEIRALNRDHRGVDEVTDVLSFPMDGAGAVPLGLPRQLGDLVVCVEHVERQLADGDTLSTHEGLREPDTTLEAAVRRCVVHGVLHLLEMDHEDDDDLGAMFTLEQRLLDELPA